MKHAEVASKLLVVAVVTAVFGLVAGEGPNRTALGADGGCSDFDGDGFVNVTDQIIFSPWHFYTVPPAPPQLDFNKDGSLTVGDQGFIASQFFASLTCQTNPLPKTSLVGGALVVDANGDNPVPTDVVQSFRNVSVGETFDVAVQLTSNPGAAAVQARLNWGPANFDLNPRIAATNVATSLNSNGISLQIVEAAYVDLANAPYFEEPPSSFVGPVMQFEFTCHTAGTAVFSLEGGHSLLAVHPSTEYKPTLTGAAIGCFGTADIDGDGQPDDYEASQVCLDAQSDDGDADPESDGLTNLLEFWLGTDPCGADSDGDGLTDGAEHQTHGTGPLTTDTEHDGFLDGYEVATPCLDPLADDRGADPDGDGLDNLTEFGLGTLLCVDDTDADALSDGYEVDNACLDPLVANGQADADSDGLQNVWEFLLATDPCVADSSEPDGDSDGLRDDVEQLIFGTDPLDPDTDGDELPDRYEVDNACLDPLLANAQLDADGDGLQNLWELLLTTNPCVADAPGPDPDGDGLPDDVEQLIVGTDPLDPDTDSDGCSDGAEVAPKAAASAGGDRDPLDVWDFMDQWTGSPFKRDKVVVVGDIGAVVNRFGTVGVPGDPNLVPGSQSGYHTQGDRGGAVPGENPWNLLPADGSIVIGDIGAVVAQFGHSCG